MALLLTMIRRAGDRGRQPDVPDAAGHALLAWHCSAKRSPDGVGRRAGAMIGVALVLRKRKDEGHVERSTDCARARAIPPLPAIQTRWSDNDAYGTSTTSSTTVGSTRSSTNT